MNSGLRGDLVAATGAPDVNPSTVLRVRRQFLAEGLTTIYGETAI